ncbi:hypothetical protein GO730_03850 [Spirosoma sp. HMF3257]|uniref:4'-phosphopantetheinyl transferase N-terminal domain-containing protein n=1 Tax=Spirosoma telluris TaxID=2183553 RepID=A0A327NF11_9BACT|nr:hypothetical protein [Spirosoma telluris]RAI73747.1 hypothetical protein HMF3257_03790 [Spirosoma telluris]
MADVFVFNTTLPGVSWQSLVACSYSDTVAVFRFQFVNDPVDLQQTELQAHEISQALRYHRQEDRNRFVYARRMLRILVGRYVKKKPNELIFKPGINNKPEIENTPEWHMNVSHSGGGLP